jgi:hypothetical protein
MSVRDASLVRIRAQCDANPASRPLAVLDDYFTADMATEAASQIAELLVHRWHPPTIRY